MLPDRRQGSRSVQEELLHRLSVQAGQQPVMSIVYSTFQCFLPSVEAAVAWKAYDGAAAVLCLAVGRVVPTRLRERSS
jgi:hypothetical protein